MGGWGQVQETHLKYLHSPGMLVHRVTCGAALGLKAGLGELTSVSSNMSPPSLTPLPSLSWVSLAPPSLQNNTLRPDFLPLGLFLHDLGFRDASPQPLEPSLTLRSVPGDRALQGEDESATGSLGSGVAQATWSDGRFFLMAGGWHRMVAGMKDLIFGCVKDKVHLSKCGVNLEIELALLSHS